MGDQSAKDFSRFDSMSTEELNMFLRGFISGPNIEEDSAEMDAVLYAMEVVAKREKKIHPENFPNVEDAWRDFMENYYPKAEAKMSEKGASKTVQIKAHDNTPARKVHRWRSMSTLSRVASIAIMVLVLGFAGMGVAQAAGYDVFGAVATWTDDIFSFRSQGGNLSTAVPPELSDGEVAYSSLQEALDAYSVTVPLAPKWIPEEYSFVEAVVNNVEDEIAIFATYMSDENVIDVTIMKHTTDSFATVEKDAGTPETYRAGGINHYIFENLGYTEASWINEEYECLLSGNDLSVNQLKKIIDSIYRR